MGKRYEKLSQQDMEFIAGQHLFFIASSADGKEVNLSPRGYDVFRITGDNEAVFADYAGSGNRTARDIEAGGEVTVLFVSFAKEPLNLRLFCKGELIDRNDAYMQTLFADTDLRGIRRFVRLHIYCVEHSCGMSVPYFEYKGEREDLRKWCAKSEDKERLEAYMEKNYMPPDLEDFRKINL